MTIGSTQQVVAAVPEPGEIAFALVASGTLGGLVLRRYRMAARAK